MSGAPILTLTLEVRALVGEPINIGVVGRGRRRVVPILGGTFEGHGELNVRGRVLPGGEDWQLIQDDGLTEADARYVLEADNGATISVRNRGVRRGSADVMRRLLAGERVDPSLVYFKSAPTFETSAQELQVLVRSIFVGVGERYPNEVVLRFWKVE
ncbi:MAG TPA: DUF3237 family protein [Vicinamibacterales bacterium]|nr:DUF3237 family protein [Vicinamibacterales bacterium]